MSNNTYQEILTPQQAAKFLGVTIGALAKWRATGHPLLPYIKAGRSVRYKQSDLDSFITKHTINGVEG